MTTITLEDKHFLSGPYTGDKILICDERPTFINEMPVAPYDEDSVEMCVELGFSLRIFSVDDGIELPPHLDSSSKVEVTVMYFEGDPSTGLSLPLSKELLSEPFPIMCVYGEICDEKGWDKLDVVALHVSVEK